MPKKKLDDEQQRVVTGWLACCQTPTRVAEWVKLYFKVTLTRQAVEAYDPTKAMGVLLSPELREHFYAKRKEYFETLDAIPFRHKAVRLNRLEELWEIDRDRGNTVVARGHIELAREETQDLDGGGDGAAAALAELVALLRKARG